MSGGSAKFLGACFEPCKPQLRWMLAGTSVGGGTTDGRGTAAALSFSGGSGGSGAVCGLEWRLDYMVRSSTTGVEHVPVYFVSLKTKVWGGEKCAEGRSPQYCAGVAPRSSCVGLTLRAR